MGAANVRLSLDSGACEGHIRYHLYISTLRPTHPPFIEWATRAGKQSSSVKLRDPLVTGQVRADISSWQARTEGISARLVRGSVTEDKVAFIWWHGVIEEMD